MIYGSLILIILLLISVGYLVYKIKKIKKINKELTGKIIEDQKKPILLGKVEAYTEGDLAMLNANPEAIEILLKIFEYKIAKKNDDIRFCTDNNEIYTNIGWLNCLYDTHLFFYKIKNMGKK